MENTMNTLRVLKNADYQPNTISQEQTNQENHTTQTNQTNQENQENQENQTTQTNQENQENQENHTTQTIQTLQSIKSESENWDDLFEQLSEPVETDISLNVYNKQEDDKKYKDLEVNIKIVETRQSNGCEICGGLIVISNNMLLCKGCGLETEQIVAISGEDTTTNINDSNVNDKGFISMRITGKGSYSYNRNLLKSCANYSQYSKMNSLKEIHNWNSQSSNIKLPKNVMEEANNMFAKIKEKGHVYRKDVKKGVQSACLYYACYNNGISKTPNEIAQVANIAEKFHSAGDRILRDLNERGVIELPKKINPILDYVNRYFEILKIPIQYKKFVLEIIYLADKEKLHVLCDSKNNTKCIGAIYMLIDRMKFLNIDKEKIDRDCDISKTTFIKYYNMLCRYYRKFIHIFIKYNIPLKQEWINDIKLYLTNQDYKPENNSVNTSKTAADKQPKSKAADKQPKDKDTNKQPKNKDTNKQTKNKAADKQPKDKDTNKQPKNKDTNKQTKNKDTNKQTKHDAADKPTKKNTQKNVEINNSTSQPIVTNKYIPANRSYMSVGLV